MNPLAEARRHQRKALEADMIIVMKADASPEQVVKVAEQVETLGLKPHVIEGSERTVSVIFQEVDKFLFIKTMTIISTQLFPLVITK